MEPVRHEIRSDANIWQLIFAFTGVGCSFVGPYLPTLLGTWGLHDHEAGIVVSCLFFGSFTGTLSLSSDLRRSLQRGCVSAFLGMSLFALCTQWTGGFLFGAASLTVMGFGLGQLMSAMNLLVGAGDSSTRSKRLAAIGAAWCIGAVLSPVLTTVQIHTVTPPWRIGMMSSLFLLLLVCVHGRQLPAAGSQVPASEERSQWSYIAGLSAVVFFVYGGIEASIADWMPLFAARYNLGSTAASQWTVSLFWIGLILGRLTLSRFFKAAHEELLLRMMTICAVLCLLFLATTHSAIAFRIACAAAGVCVGPVFPLLLSSTLQHALHARVMGGILAACGLGAAVLPYLLGLLSFGWSLRTGMLLPLGGLSLLLVLCWRPGLRKPLAMHYEKV